MRFVFVLFLFIAGLTQAFADPNRVTGILRVEFGWVLGADGQRHSIKGIELPYVAERIDSGRLTRLHRGRKASGKPIIPPPAKDLPGIVENMLASISPTAAPVVTGTVYNSDDGVNYATATLEGPDPSSLDGHAMVGGAGQNWQNLKFGVNITTSRVFQIHWRVFTSFTPGLGSGVSAFGGQVANFGVIFATNPPFYTNPYAVGTWIVTINAAAAGVVCPSDFIYMAQMFRMPPWGDDNAPFDVAMENVYSFVNPPTVGTSDASFYYDASPREGIFAEDEVDQFEPPNLANLVRTITTSGVSETDNPFQHSLYGVLVSGVLVDLWDSDDAYLIFTPRFDGSRTDPHGMLTVEGVASTTNLTSFQFRCETGASIDGGTQRIELFNYTSGQWDQVASQAITQADSTINVSVSTGIGRYVNSTNRRMLARIKFFVPLNANRGYQLRVDRTVWILTHP